MESKEGQHGPRREDLLIRRHQSALPAGVPRRFLLLLFFLLFSFHFKKPAERLSLRSLHFCLLPSLHHAAACGKASGSFEKNDEVPAPRCCTVLPASGLHLPPCESSLSCHTVSAGSCLTEALPNSLCNMGCIHPLLFIDVFPFVYSN